jgi:phosphohistidine phosphatase
MLLRHAKSASGEGSMRDRDRPLNPRGRADAPKMGAYMARHGLLPDQAIVSSAKRTRETWQLLSTGFSDPPPVVFEDKIYEAELNALFDIVTKTVAQVHSLLLIGHNPGTHKLALSLIASGDVDLREQLREALPTCGFISIDFAFDDWKDLHPRSGRLDRFVTPATLQTTTD